MARGDVYSHQRKTISIVRNIIDGDAIDQLYLQVMDMMSGWVVGQEINLLLAGEMERKSIWQGRVGV